MESRSGKKGNPGEGGETVIIGDKTVLLNDGHHPLIFAWLVEVDRENIIRIDRDVFTIGASSSANLVLSLPGVQDIHGSIYFVDNHFELNDNNSRGGTMINGRAIKRQVLADNDVISIGAGHFQLKCFQGEYRG